MLEVLIKIICSLIMAISGVLIIEKITNVKINLLSFTNICIILLSQLLPCILYSGEYHGLYTILIYFINIIVYKILFKKNLTEILILSAIQLIVLFFADFITTMLLRIFFTTPEIRNTWYLMLAANFMSSSIGLIIVSFKRISNFFHNIANKLSNIKHINSITFIFLLLIFFCIMSNSVIANTGWNINFLMDIFTITIFITLLIIYTNEKNHIENIEKQYDGLFKYVQSFEDWIEKEQINRHEYKNQLAVIRCLTKEKKVKNKIDEILEDNINIEGQVVHKLKELPKGGLKGLMYYKAALAQKDKIRLEIDICLEKKTILNKLSKLQVRVLCNLIGIYFDNAIEAARETKKKTVLLEMYELKDKVNIVISNTFKRTKNFDNRNNRGVTTKGEGHGNGLYLAKKLIEKNDWIESKQEVIDKYYIQTLIIKN